MTTGPIAYLTSEYPKVSHTFILREVEALRGLGLDVRTCSVRQPEASEFKGAAEQEALASTFSIIGTSRRAPWRLALAHLRLVARAPRRWAGALRLALRERRPGLKGALWHLFYFAEAGLLADHLRRIGAEHLHCHFGNAGCSVAMLAAHLADLPYSFTVHGPDEFFHPYEYGLASKIARAHFVVAISHFCRSQLMLFSDPAHWDKIAIVHCGIEPALYAAAEDAEETRTGGHVLFIGRLGGVKGAPVLLEAFARVQQTRPETRLTIVGDGPERAALAARAAALGLQAAVRFTGFQTQDEVAGHLAAADMLTLPSFAEGVPVVLMEAAAAGLPVIASQVAGVPELVRDGETGLIVPPGDTGSLAAALLRLAGDPALARRMGAAGRDVVAHEFDAGLEAAWLARLFAGTDGGALRPGGPETGPQAESGTRAG